MIKMNLHRVAALALLSSAFALPSISQAALIVDWGGDYVNSTLVAFSGSFTNSSTGSGYGGFLAGENPIELTPSSGYTGGRIYGSILELTNVGASLGSVNGVGGTGATDLMLLKSDTGSAAAFLILWQQADFLTLGANSGNVSFDATSSVRLNTTSYTAQNATDSGRLVIRLTNGSYYISERVFTDASNRTVSNLTGLNFFNYAPATSLGVDNGSLGVAASILSSGSITGITSVGFYFESDTAANAVRITDFEVNAIVSLIPEPSTYALLAGGLTFAIGLCRRRA
jgi:hypothetical protein